MYDQAVDPEDGVAPSDGATADRAANGLRGRYLID
jgi:hypothetical protein